MVIVLDLPTFQLEEAIDDDIGHVTQQKTWIVGGEAVQPIQAVGDPWVVVPCKLGEIDTELFPPPQGITDMVVVGDGNELNEICEITTLEIAISFRNVLEFLPYGFPPIRIVLPHTVDEEKCVLGHAVELSWRSSKALQFAREETKIVLLI